MFFGSNHATSLTGDGFILYDH